ncbi:GntR family transcriptional regulator [Sphingosinicella sp.]|uniref:GntR family transcriptional regulator n=1 Tax=Sphingosinicella sp. TaxID=1917971 RepID=UPI004037942F
MSAALAERLRERILSGAAGPGQPIRQDTLAAELGVSKIPLREALARLEEEGLLRSEVNRGWFVTPLTAAEAREVYALRLTLEPGSAARAAARASMREQAQAIIALEELEAAMAGHGDVGALNRAFHLALVRPAGQPLTFDIVQRLHVISERYVRKHLEPQGRDARAHDEHRALVEAWLARDEKAVTRLLLAHIGQTLDDLEGQLDGQKEGD